MIHRLEIINKNADTRALVRKNKISANSFGKKIKEVVLVDVYSIDKKLSVQQLNKIVFMLINSVVQKAGINRFLHPKEFSWAIEIGYLPGVKDNIASTAQELIEDLLKIKFNKQENVYSSQITFLTGKFTENEVKKIAGSLYNPIIMKAKIKSYHEYMKDKGMGYEIPKIKLDLNKNVNEVDLNVNDEQLSQIGKNGITNPDGTRRGPLALDLTFMKTIQKYFKNLDRNPTDIELESIAQTWSEHCKHTIFSDPIDEIKDGLFKHYIKAATDKIRKNKGKKDFCVSVFTDNSGAIKFDDKYLITHKVETHNSPSALDPFGGAITGIVGVNRDAIGFGIGAKPIINTYGFCFADLDDNLPLYKGPNFTQKMLEPRRIMDGVIEGVNSGGNCSGIPTPQGFMVFDMRYKGKPLVFVGTAGLIPRKINGKNSHLKKAQPGDYIVMVGGRVGLDGIHGATFSSEAMDKGSPSTAVQIGDPITQKKLSDTIVKEARDLNLYNSITDNGAGGLSCSVAEMAQESDGCYVNLDKVPLKYPGLSPWQIWISESQERMTLAVPKNKWKKFNLLMKRRGVEASVIGRFTKSGKCIVNYHGQKVMNIGLKFLHDGLPRRPLKTVYVQTHYPEPHFSLPIDLSQTITQMLMRKNLAGFEFLSMQYDHEVQGGSVIKPLQGKGRINADASVTKPILTSNYGVIISQGICPTYSEIDTYYMSACAIDMAIRNAISTGADLDHLALLDNFCWCSGNDPQRLGQLKKAVQACYDYAVIYGTPFISGKDSMFNDFKGYDDQGNPVKISVPPTLLISSIGIIRDVTKSVSIDLKFPGDLIYLLGDTYDELGGSEYFAYLGEKETGESYIGNIIPKVDARKNKQIYHDLFRCIDQELISSAISVNRGGLATALVKTAIAGMLGIDISLDKLPSKASRIDYTLFSESQGRIIISLHSENKEKFEKIMNRNVFKQIGKVTDRNTILIRANKDREIVNLNLMSALKAYKSTFKYF